ncbi:dihydrolipoyl dehydrogenase family protein [Candidatus Methylobacter oryzae]|uniref:Dihydrolipoyl dehydrogenase n=1 Tax=Candidatus Methylobacter oryzae TaxID=2497749 RepID=A0ABY3C539_9GAMM|nr:dihydrolipoyl dehydrogenase [Candidatus Methylobacter oryzae]
MEGAQLKTEVLVLGGGPGGYTAAFRAADLGKQVTLVERYPVLGGVCLNVGCIPSKALLHVAAVLNEAKELSAAGIGFAEPDIDLEKLRSWKNNIASQLTTGLAALAKQRNVTVVKGVGRFISDTQVVVEDGDDSQTIEFKQAIIAVGSQPVKISSFPNDDPRLMNSTDALNVESIPQKLLIIGGGIIGLEMATVYNALGSKITVVEMQDQIIPGCDKDLVRPLMQRIKKQYDNIFLETQVKSIEALPEGLKVSFDRAIPDDQDKNVPEIDLFDKVLVAVGRRPNGHLIDVDKAGVNVDQRGFIRVDKQQRTNVKHIFAIGDVTGNPMLAHKATHEGKIAAEVIAGMATEWRALTIPSVAYTDPEIAWMGVTKLLSDKQTGRILGAGVVGTHAGELIAEAVLALEMGAGAEDLALTVHAHPTLSETLGFSAEMLEGTITDLFVRKR